MKQIKYLEVYNSRDGYGSLFARYSNMEIALKQLRKSSILKSTIMWDNENIKINNFSHTSLRWDDEYIKDLKLEVDDESHKIIYKAKISFNVYNEEIIPGVKEEGKPYKSSQKIKKDEQVLYCDVSGFIHFSWITLNLDGIPAHRGELTDDLMNPVEQEIYSNYRF